MYTLYTTKWIWKFRVPSVVKKHSTGLIAFFQILYFTVLMNTFDSIFIDSMFYGNSFHTFCLSFLYYIEHIINKTLFIFSSLIGLSLCFCELLVTFYLPFCTSGYILKNHGGSRNFVVVVFFLAKEGFLFPL